MWSGSAIARPDSTVMQVTTTSPSPHVRPIIWKSGREPLLNVSFARGVGC
jgi:hypothetical protein